MRARWKNHTSSQEGKRLDRLSQFKVSKNSSVRDRKTIAYARIASTDQKSDLDH